MGILIALTPFVQFFASPILGSLSDQKGRKSMILFGLAMGLIGYCLGVLGIKLSSLALLVLYRAFFGVCSATMTVIQAAMVDISSKEKKARNFGLYNMALGTGFTFGPFLGGFLSDSSIVPWFNFSTPFLLGAVVTGLNLVLLKWKFAETKKTVEKVKVDFFRGIRHAKTAFSHPVLKFAFLSFFVFLFGWDYFMQFVPVTLKAFFDYTTGQIGTFFAFMGLCYALCVGVLVGPLVKRFKPSRLLHFSMLSCGVYILSFLLIDNPVYFWVFIPGLNVIMALFYPVAATYISDNATEETQGEALGVYHSVQALALILSPLCSGSLVGSVPGMPIYLGSALTILGGLIFAGGYAISKRRVHRLDEGS